MKTYANGPVEDRKCTDTFCLIIFIALSITILAIGIYSWASGDFKKLTTPYDVDRKGCGVDYPEYPFIYFASPSADSLWVTVCVSECPKANETSLKCQVNSIVTSCNARNSSDKTKVVNVYETTPVAGTVCLPTSETINQEVSGALVSQAGQSRISDIRSSWVIILVSMGIAILAGFIFMLIMRCCSGIIIWILIFFSVAALVAIGVFLLLPKNEDTTTSFSSFQGNQGVTIAIAVLCLILGLVLLIVVCCFRKRIALAVKITQVAARFVASEFFIFLLPIVLFVVSLIFITVWILEALGFYSLGTPVNEPKQLPFQHFKTTLSIKVLAVVHVFYLLWGILFLVETCGFIVAGAAASWYFKKDSPYADSRRRYMKYHMGSVALGSFLMALVGFLKLLYDLLTPDSDDKEGCLGKWKSFCNCLCCICVSYLFTCFNHNAYTWIHLTGDSYCESAGKVLALEVKNIASTGAVAVVSIIFNMLGRVTITAITCAISYQILKTVSPYAESVSEPFVPTIVIGLLAFAIASFFVSLYSDSADAVYICYLAETEDGSKGNCPEELTEFLEEARKNNNWK